MLDVDVVQGGSSLPAVPRVVSPQKGRIIEMLKQRPFLAAAALAALVPLSPLGSAAEEAPSASRLAMMDMMPMGGGSMQQAAQAPGGGLMDDDMMRMGGGGMSAQGQNQMPMGQMPQQQQTMGMCPMMGMMQNMMRMGAGQQQGMAPIQGGAGSGMRMGMGAMQPMGSPAARLEGRIAFLRAELRINDAQAPAWERFAAALRSGREHLDAARAALQDSNTGTDPMARLEAYENHLKARSEAIHVTRMAFNTLYGQLDEAQKRAATVTMLPFIGAF